MPYIYDKACKEVNYDYSLKCPITENIIFYAYKGGVCKEFDSEIEAKKFSKNIERVNTSKAAYDAWRKVQREKESEAIKLWIKYLKEEYVDSKFTEQMFNVCYSEAIDRGASRYEEIENYLSDYVAFACRILALVPSSK